uniref:Fungal lipase-like domain-containing protein n=1 Tax=Panagrolaimus superbus TaxID=310955 RepID=A0A914YSX6_9BILA
MAVTAFSSVPQKCINDTFEDGELIGQYTVICDKILTDTCSGFLAVSHSDKAIIISFRGTLGDEQLSQEFIDSLIDPLVNFVGGGKINAYFSSAFTKIWNHGMRDAFFASKNKYANYTLWITGHSLGAAMAAIAGGTIVKLGYFPANETIVYTFGEPRVGNKDFAAALDSLLPTIYRVIHAHDMVPHIPLEGVLGYYHHKREVWYNNNMARGDPFIICEEDEDKKCSNSENVLIWSDHDVYFGANIEFALNGCIRL